MTTLRLSKHHGLGNDFLVLLDQDGRPRAWPSGCATAAPASAPTACWSGTAGGPDQADLTMVLFNADGSRAEMSGNGIRCLAQAWVQRAGPTAGPLRIATDAGPAHRPVEADRRPGRGRRPRRHGQGPARPGPRGGASPRASTGSATVDMGNPHLVLLVDDVAGRRRRRRRARLERPLRRAASTSSGSRRDRPGTASSSGCGSGAPATRRPAAPAPAPPPTPRTPGAWSASGSPWPWRAATWRSRWATRSRLVGPATHIADVDGGR